MYQPAPHPGYEFTLMEAENHHQIDTYRQYSMQSTFIQPYPVCETEQQPIYHQTIYETSYTPMTPPLPSPQYVDQKSGVEFFSTPLQIAPPSSASSSSSPSSSSSSSFPVVNYEQFGFIETSIGVPPHPTKRNKANKKEKHRTAILNAAYNRLREAIPNIPIDTKMSKIKILLLAIDYIKYLINILDDQDCTAVERKYRACEDFVANLTRTPKMKRNDELMLKDQLKPKSGHQELCKPPLYSPPGGSNRKRRSGWPTEMCTCDFGRNLRPDVIDLCPQPSCRLRKRAKLNETFDIKRYPIQLC